MDKLISRHCVPCEGGTPPLTPDQVKQHSQELGSTWEVQENVKIKRSFTLTDFKQTVEFFNQIADLAEAEGHHPDLHLTNYKHLTVELSTHAVGGLSDNDFIMAAKIDLLYDELPTK